MIKVIGSDMDGRLVKGGDEIMSMNEEGIKFGEGKGIRVVIGSGRGFYEGERGVGERELKVR
ncbi:HAD hydrolase family protein [Staphylococcus epidermidis]|uniref:HAD hydrolase family protein n=1 Tax=Staphylococcus epidermidis TaxID=1282 RepID=UPI0011A27C59|nr:HAD hydrolase family protein [Staphylococcus epidermidis]